MKKDEAVIMMKTMKALIGEKYPHIQEAFDMAMDALNDPREDPARVHMKPTPYCPECQHTLQREGQPYCDECGQKLEWPKD